MKPAVLAAAAVAAVVIASVIVVHLSRKREPSIPCAAKFVGMVNHGSRANRRIALTFDACSGRHSGFDARLLDILQRGRVPGTVFLGGEWMNRHPREVELLKSVPNLELGMHGFGHPHMTRLTEEKIALELDRAQDAFTRLVGRRASLFRPPYGECDERIARIAAARGLVTVGFDLASGDPDPRFTRARLVRGVVRSARNGSIVVMHINGKGRHTAKAVPEIVSELEKKGYSFATVSDLLRDLEEGRAR